jgi:chloramphenicol O-acetyltransferase type A
MAEIPVDLATWGRAAQFALFRGYERPQYSITTRLDVTRLVARKADGVSPYRACVFAIGFGLHAVPELRMRLRGAGVVLHDRIALSVTAPRRDGGFNYADLPFDPDFARFDAEATRRLEAAQDRDTLGENDGVQDAVAYLSCLPWLDFTAVDNALRDRDDCIPRVSWGRFTPEGDRTRMAMAIQVHHALVDGEHLGGFFAAVQRALDAV